MSESETHDSDVEVSDSSSEAGLELKFDNLLDFSDKLQQSFGGWKFSMANRPEACWLSRRDSAARFMYRLPTQPDKTDIELNRGYGSSSLAALLSAPHFHIGGKWWTTNYHLRDNDMWSVNLYELAIFIGETLKYDQEVEECKECSTEQEHADCDGARLTKPRFEALGSFETNVTYVMDENDWLKQVARNLSSVCKNAELFL